MLDERGRDWQQRFPPAGRRPAAAEAQPGPGGDPRSRAVGPGQRLRPDHARQSRVAQPSSIVYDETPIHVYMARIKDQLSEKGRLAFRELFEPGMSKSALVGIFLAILELVRHEHARAEQERAVRRNLDHAGGRAPCRVRRLQRRRLRARQARLARREPGRLGSVDPSTFAKHVGPRANIIVDRTSVSEATPRSEAAMHARNLLFIAICAAALWAFKASVFPAAAVRSGSAAGRSPIRFARRPAGSISPSSDYGATSGSRRPPRPMTWRSPGGFRWL